MGGALYPESLIRVRASCLGDGIHIRSHLTAANNNRGSSKTIIPSSLQNARQTLAKQFYHFFQAPPEYACVFTSNASTALKLVGESLPFADGSSFVLGADSHNSVNGLREFATHGGARVCYIESATRGGNCQGPPSLR
jgi:molybdenum cofactor sulfurtransferase